MNGKEAMIFFGFVFTICLLLCIAYKINIDVKKFCLIQDKMPFEECLVRIGG